MEGVGYTGGTGARVNKPSKARVDKPSMGACPEGTINPGTVRTLVMDPPEKIR